MSCGTPIRNVLGLLLHGCWGMCHIPLPTILPSSASKGLLESMVEKVMREIDSELSTETVLRESLKEAEYVDTLLLCPLLDCLHIRIHRCGNVHCLQGLVCKQCTYYTCSRSVLSIHVVRTYTTQHVHVYVRTCTHANMHVHTVHLFNYVHSYM